jgi:dimethylhistidine N-methyltransferase
VLAAIRAGLSERPRRLPPECFYDDLGSALFEAITLLPEYGLTRAGVRLFTRHAPEMAARLRGALDVVELGSGSGRKTRLLLEELVRGGSVRYLPVDISAAALGECAREIGERASLWVEPIQASHLEGLRKAAGERRDGAAVLVLFLGSNIGNFNREEQGGFVRAIREELRPGDALLLAADLEKPESVLLPAYDDPIGLTAAFNLNVLARLNRELGADFDPRGFSHWARYDKGERRMEMHLVSLRPQRALIPALDLALELAQGESLWTESSYKFARGEIARLGQSAGFTLRAEWVDQEWPFCQVLFSVVSPA